MRDTRLKLVALAVACCFVLILVPVANAQVGGAIQKGVHGVEKGVDTGVEKTKEGAEATKNAITGEDQNQNQNQNQNQDQNRMKPEESQTNPSTSSETEQKSNEKEQKNMPRTAGELPLLALAGCLALTAAGLSRVIRRQKNY